MFNKDLEELKSKHLEELNSKQTKMYSTINEIKNAQEGISSRITKEEKRISDLEDKRVETTATEQNKEKRMKRIEDSFRAWDNIKCNHFLSIGVPEEEEKKEGSEKIFEEIIVEKFPIMVKGIVNQVRDRKSVV